MGMTGLACQPTTNTMARRCRDTKRQKRCIGSIRDLEYHRFLPGTCHRVSHRHLRRYLDDFCYRLNRRAWERQLPLPWFRDYVAAPRVTYAQLTASAHYRIFIESLSGL